MNTLTLLMIMEMKLQMYNKTKGVDMNLNDLLKVNNVRCIKTKVHEDLVDGEIYKVEGFNDEVIKIVDRNGFSSWHNKNLFEPVLNNDTDLDELLKHLEVGRSWEEIGCNNVVTITEIESEFANNIMVAFESECCLSSSPLRMFLKDFTPVINNDMSKSDSEIDISLNSVHGVNTTFEVGDKVYRYGETDVKTVLEVFNDEYVRISNYPYRVNHEVLCYATPENHATLSKPYPHIEFELPPKEITGSDLTKWLLERGDFAVVCRCSNIGEYSARVMPLRLITEYNKGRFLDNTGRLWGYAVPCDPKTGVPLTEGVLNETI